MRRWTGPIVLVLAAALGAAGCGGGDGGGTTTATATTARTTAQAATQPTSRAVAGSAEEAAQRLRAGGYSVSQLDVNPPALAARKVGNQVLLYEYQDAAAAKKGAAVIKDAIKDRPDRGVVDAEGRRVYFLGETHPVTARERAAFSDLVDVGEGRTSP